MLQFSSLAITDPDALTFGVCPNPLRITPEITLGAGETFPEVNYILPYNTEVSERTIEDVIALYRRMATGALERACYLGIDRFVIEIELVFEMTQRPEWGEAILRTTRETMDSYRDRGVHTALRATVADIRDRARPPRNRTGAETRQVFETFERCAPYADILSIESTGGKEVSDEAILQCNAGAVAFALGELGSRDMAFLWKGIVDIARKHGKIAGGDAACGFANTAMQLANKRMIPGVFAAVVRAMGAARSLVAIEYGATGPDKDCAYEGPVLKAIAGIPIAMEGKSAVCAHSSPLGNVAMCCCDLWSNESVPYAQLFGGYTPEVSLEQLWYDCKLLNEARKAGCALTVRNLLRDSDIRSSAQALILSPESSVRIANAIIRDTDYAERTLNAAHEAVAIIEEACAAGNLVIPPIEAGWLDMIKASLDEFADQGAHRLDYYAAMFPETFLPAEYGL